MRMFNDLLGDAISHEMQYMYLMLSKMVLLKILFYVTLLSTGIVNIMRNN